MLMTRKRKLKIASMLAAIIHIAENEPNITPKAFEKLIGNALDVSYEVGSFHIMEATMEYVKALRGGSDT